ncbi:putative regulatory protein, FmdB family [Thermodesulfovibrio aggregans]|uniref:Putative regulatory protein, FmdB family n=1 Tax=Thermodesulfovibrio aggregans TaxID=86166 RepID=A0A0U9HVK7_9BACT|nr:FmdB family zinc ribbon protein [Thermodesulfovibrio aggregans]GAQ94929.1 putative regulatory protein, FmdB family [Thermodesulfovibrio aggregans]
MPIYEYECMECHKIHEVIQKFSDKPLKNCPVCGGELKKLISLSSFVLKGTGWYVTDYARKNNSENTSNSNNSDKTSKKSEEKST